MFIAFRQANLSFTDTCNTDEEKKKNKTALNSPTFTLLRKSTLSVSLGKITVLSQFFSLLFSFILQSIYHLGNCEVGNHFFTLAVVFRSLFITGFEIGAPLIISENKRSKV